MNARRRVMVTGIGLNTPIGSGREVFWEACLQGKQSVAPIPTNWPGRSAFNSTIWSPLPDDTFKDVPLNRAERMQLDPVQILALMSAKSAIEDAGIRAVLIDEKKIRSILPIFPAIAAVSISAPETAASIRIPIHAISMYSLRWRPNLNPLAWI